MIHGVASDDDIRTITLSIAGRCCIAIIDTGFNGDLELVEELREPLGARYVGRATVSLAGGQTIEEDVYLVDFPFDGRIVQAEATFVSGTRILLGPGCFRGIVLKSISQARRSYWKGSIPQPLVDVRQATGCRRELLAVRISCTPFGTARGHGMRTHADRRRMRCARRKGWARTWAPPRARTPSGSVRPDIPTSSCSRAPPRDSSCGPAHTAVRTTASRTPETSPRHGRPPAPPPGWNETGVRSCGRSWRAGRTGRSTRRRAPPRPGPPSVRPS